MLCVCLRAGKEAGKMQSVRYRLVVASAILVLAGVSAPEAAFSKQRFPTVKELATSPDKCYVLAQFTPLAFGHAGTLQLYEDQQLATKLLPKGQRVILPVRLQDLPASWPVLSADEEKFYSSWARSTSPWARSMSPSARSRFHRVRSKAAVLLWEVRAGRYQLYEYHGQSLYYTSRDKVTVPLKDFDREFSVSPGEVVYIGSIWFGPPERYRMACGFSDSLPAALSALDAVEPGLARAVAERVVKAAYLSGPPAQELRAQAVAWVDEMERTRERAALLFEGVDSGDASAVSAALLAGADVNTRFRKRPGMTRLGKMLGGGSGYTALHVAANKGNRDVVELLLAEGADVNDARNDEGQAPIFVATQALWQSLIANGADVNAHDADGDTLLHRAGEWNRYDKLAFLLTNGADAACRNDAGRTPLMEAARHGHRRAVEMLLAHGVDPDGRGKDGNSPLHLIGTIPFAPGIAIAQVLLGAGADVNAENMGGNTPLHVAACYSSCEDVVEVLLARGADPNWKNKEGRTPLHQAAYWGNVGSAAALLSAGADPNCKNKKGETPLQLAKTQDMRTLLRSHGAAG